MKNINEQKVNLPNGEYNTLWSGGKMEIVVVGNKNVIIDTNIQVKGINCEQKIKIEDGDVSTIH